MVIDAKEGKRLMDELGDKVLILDVRHAFEFNNGHIPNAILIDNDEISSTVKHPDLPDDFDRPILIYCRSGVRSNYAMKTAWNDRFTSRFPFVLKRQFSMLNAFESGCN